HDLAAGIDHRICQVRLVGDHGLAALQRLAPLVEGEPGRADVRLTVERVAADAALGHRDLLAVLDDRPAHAAAVVAAGVDALGEARLLLDHPGIEVRPRHDHDLAPHLRVPGAAVLGAEDLVAARLR